MKNPLIQDAVIRNLEVIGEASRNIFNHCPDFARAHPEVPLASANQMRNALIHGYFQVDLEIVWNTIQTELPDLHAKLSTALQEAWPTHRGLGLFGTSATHIPDLSCGFATSRAQSRRIRLRRSTAVDGDLESCQPIALHP